MLDLELLWYKIKLELNKNKYKDEKLFLKRDTKEILELNWFYATDWVFNEIFQNDEEKMRMILIWIVHSFALMWWNNLDFLQVWEINWIKIWIIDDWEKITFLLPSEY